MDLDLDTFLTVVYCTVDTVYQAQFAARNRCGLATRRS